MTQNISLDERMKRYENVSRYYLTRRQPVIIRIDGKAFHSLTRKHFGKHWNAAFLSLMMTVAKKVYEEIQGCEFCYSQSDEISFLLTDYKTIRTEPWFDYNLQKLVSISAAVASSKYTIHLEGELVMFDSRAFSLPQDEVTNYFIWRQRDATRNAILMAGQEYFSHKELYKKSTDEVQEMLFQKHQINFNDFPTIRKRGFVIAKGEVDWEIPIFSKDRNYIEKFVNVRED